MRRAAASFFVFTSIAEITKITKQTTTMRRIAFANASLHWNNRMGYLPVS
jgi:hypothetical protein